MPPSLLRSPPLHYLVCPRALVPIVLLEVGRAWFVWCRGGVRVPCLANSGLVFVVSGSRLGSPLDCLLLLRHVSGVLPVELVLSPIRFLLPLLHTLCACWRGLDSTLAISGARSYLVCIAQLLLLLLRLCQIRPCIP